MDTRPKIARPLTSDELRESGFQPVWKERSEITKGLAASVDELQALGGGAVGLAGQALGLESVRDWGLDTYRQNMVESVAGWQAPKVARYEDIGETGSFGDWVKYKGAKGLGTLASLALGGGVGGAIGKQLVKKQVRDIAKAQAGKAMMGRAPTVLKEGAKETAQGLAKKEVKQAQVRGAVAGGLGAAFGMEGGGAFGQQTSEGVNPEDALLPSATVGAVNAALELVAPYRVAKSLGLTNVAKEGMRTVIAKDKVLRKKAVNLAGRVLKGAFGTAGTEGVTEAVQELVQEAGSRWAKDEELLAGLDAESRSQILNAAAEGTLTGFLFGGAAGPFTPGKRVTGAPTEATVRDQLPEEMREGAEIPPPQEGELATDYFARVNEEARRAAEEKAAAEAAEETARAAEPEPTAPIEPEVPEVPISEEPTTLTEEQQDAETIREDEGGVPPVGQEREGVQADRGDDRELAAEERREETGEVSPEAPLGRPTRVETPAKETVTKPDGTGWETREQAVQAIARMQRDGRLVSARGRKQDAVTRKTDEDWVIDRLESRAGAQLVDQGPPPTKEELRQTFAEGFGQDWVKRAERLGVLEIDDTPKEAGSPAAEFDRRTGKMIFYPQAMGSTKGLGTALHEASHASMDTLLGGRLGQIADEINKRGFAERTENTAATEANAKAEAATQRYRAEQVGVVDQFTELADQGQVEEARALVDEAVAALPEEQRNAINENAQEVKAEEIVAYYVESAYERGQPDGLLRKTLNKIKAGWLTTDLGRALGKAGVAPRVSDGVAVELAQRSARYALGLREELDRLGAPSVTEGDRLATFAGQEAVGADLQKLGTAKRLSDEGLDSEDVRRQTGWHRGAEGQWRYEIDDSQAELQPEYKAQPQFKVENEPLMNLLQHDKLLSAYPGLATIEVNAEIDPTGPRHKGFVKYKDGVPTITMKARTQKDLESALLHELQHAVQFDEKFAEGGSAANIDVQALAESGKLPEWREGLDNWQRQLAYQATIATAEGKKEEATRLRNKLGDINRMIRATDQMMESEQGAKQLQYMRLAGEMEARNVQARRAMTPEQRRDVPPDETLDLPAQDAIVRLGGKDVKGGLNPANALTKPQVEVDPARVEQKAQELKEINDTLDSDAPAIERVSGALQKARQADLIDPTQPLTLESRPEGIQPAWITSPTSTEIPEMLHPGFLNKLQHNYVEKFNDLWQMSEKAAAKFNLAVSKRSAAQKNFETNFIKPWRDLMLKLSKDMSTDERKYSVDNLNDAWAAWHIAKDNANVLLAQKNSNRTFQSLIDSVKGYEKSLDKADPLRTDLQKMRIEWEKGKKNLLKGKNWDGTQPYADDNVTERELTAQEVKWKMMEKLEQAFDAPVQDSKVWKVDEGIHDLRMAWEMMKHHGAGMATPDKISQDPEVQRDFNQLMEIQQQTGTPLKNAYDTLGEVEEQPAFARATPMAKDIAKKGRDALVQGGLITQQEANAMAREYQHWVPLRRQEYDFESDVNRFFGIGKRSGRPMIRAGDPSVNPPVHTMQNLMASYDANVTAAESNIARKYLAEAIETNPDHWEQWFTVEQDKDSRKSVDKYGFVKEQKSVEKTLDIPFYRDGERWLIKPNLRNERASMLSNAIQNLDSQELGPVFKMMNKVNSWIRWTNISASPAFLLMNAPRDYFTAMLNLKGTEIADFTKDVRKEVVPSVKQLKKHFWDGELDSDILEWEKYGGRISFVESLRPNDDTWGSLEAQIKHRQGTFDFGAGIEGNFGPGVGAAVGKAREGLEKIEMVNILAENVMRYSTWKVAKEKFMAQGMNEQQAKDKAALLSKDVTTNFDRKGLRSQALGTYWLFYNATVQGNAQVLRNMFRGSNKEKLWTALGGVMALAFINDQLGAAASGDEDGDGRSDWDSTPEWKKEKFGRIAGSNLLWPGEESTFATIPLPWVFNTVWRFGEMVSESFRGVKDASEIPEDVLGMMFNTFNPISSSDTTWLQAVAPTAADPIAQIIEDTDAFGRPLGPTQFPGQELRPDSEMAWLNTPPRYKWLARQVNELTGGSPAEEGLVDWRPSTYKVLADTLMGGGGRFFERLGTSLGTTVSGDLPEVKDVPGLRTFAFSPEGDSIEAQLYHERLAQVERAKHAEKVFKAGPTRDLMELQRVKREYAGELRMVPMANDVQRQLKDLRKQLRTAQARGQESRAAQLQRQIGQVQERFNKSWARRVGN